MTGRVYLTAVLELHPSRRKAAALERQRAAYEDAYWSIVGGLEETSAAILNVSDRRQRRAEYSKVRALAFAAAYDTSLCEPLRQGLARDVERSVSSFVEFTLTGRSASWPKIRKAEAIDGALDELALSITREDEEAARNRWMQTEKSKPRPMTLARARDASILRTGPGGRIGVALNILVAGRSDHQATMAPGVDAVSGEETKKSVSASRVVMPASCSKWTEYKFLSGSAILRSSIVSRRGDRWFMHAQFELPPQIISEPRSFIGIDRGLINTLALAVVRTDGSVLQIPDVSGSEVADVIKATAARADSARQRGAKTISSHRSTTKQILHNLANGVVALAKEHRSTVVMENLAGLKSTITSKRPKGARRNHWQRVLNKAQFGKMEEMLHYKLAAAGLPQPIYVLAAGTSITCSCCGHQHKDNRQSRDVFQCLECGFTADADINAAVQIARRGTMKVKKGDRLVDLHKNMVESLRARDDGGLGPLLESSGKGLVAAHVSGPAPDECFGTDNADLGQEVTYTGQNVGDHVFSERAAQLHIEGQSNSDYAITAANHTDEATVKDTALTQNMDVSRGSGY